MGKANYRLTRIQLTITLCLILFLAVTGTTFAFYAVAGSNSNTITGDMAMASLSLNVTKVYPASNVQNTGVMVPQLSSDAALGSALRGGCVDGNLNVACQVYKIVLTGSSSDVNMVVRGNISFYGNSTMSADISPIMPNLKWKLVQSVDEVTSGNSVLGSGSVNAAVSQDSLFVDNVVMANDTVTYYVIVWINEVNVDQSDQSSKTITKRFFGKVTFDSSNGTGITSYFD